MRNDWSWFLEPWEWIRNSESDHDNDSANLSSVQTCSGSTGEVQVERVAFSCHNTSSSGSQVARVCNCVSRWTSRFFFFLNHVGLVDEIECERRRESVSERDGDVFFLFLLLLLLLQRWARCNLTCEAATVRASSLQLEESGERRYTHRLFVSGFWWFRLVPGCLVFSFFFLFLESASG